jgi:predicted aspartyl protease
LLVTFGPTVKVSIGFDPNFVPNQGRLPVAGITDLNALVDTGATECCIDALLAAHLNLPAVDRRPVAGIHGSREVTVYMAQVHVQAPLDFTMYGLFAGVDLIAGGQPHHALIGRTFLKYFTMYYDGISGSVLLTLP